MALFCVKSRFSRDSKAYRVVSGRFVVESNFWVTKRFAEGRPDRTASCQSTRVSTKRPFFQISTNAKKVTVSVLYWYEKLSGNIVPQFLKPARDLQQKKESFGTLVFPRLWPCLCGKRSKIVLVHFSGRQSPKVDF